MEIKYKFYPSLLNAFQMYLNEDGYEDAEGNQKVFVDFEKLINQINRVPFETTEAMVKGNNFESDVLLVAKSDFNNIDYQALSTNAKNIEYVEMLKEVVAILPWAFTTQKFVRKIHKDIEFYGFIDFAGAGKIIDTKFSAQYQFPKFANNFQNLYLWATKDQGFKSLEYVVSNGKLVFREIYSLDYLFDELLQKMELFADFLEQNKDLITDTKIFNYRYASKV